MEYIEIAKIYLLGGKTTASIMKLNDLFMNLLMSNVGKAM